MAQLSLGKGGCVCCGEGQESGQGEAMSAHFP